VTCPLLLAERADGAGVRRAGSGGTGDPTRHDDQYSSRPSSMVTAMPLLNDFTMNYMNTSYFAAPAALVVEAVSPCSEDEQSA